MATDRDILIAKRDRARQLLGAEESKLPELKLAVNAANKAIRASAEAMRAYAVEADKLSQAIEKLPPQGK
jgi:predicted secreted protein